MITGYPPETLVNAEQVIDYRSSAATTGASRTATRLIFVVTLLIPASLIAFRLLRRHQLSLPDPYNSPYTIWSTACLLAFFVLTVVNLVLLLVFRRRVAPGARRLGS